MRIAIFTHVAHHKSEGAYFAYSPYVREMDLWFKTLNSEFRIQNLDWEVEVVAPLVQYQNSSGFLSYQSFINFTRIPSFDLVSLGSIFSAILRIPYTSYKIIGAMRRAEHLHLRCPGNIGLLACICQIFFPKKAKTAKYAGNWDPKAKQPWSYKLQRWILGNTFLTKNMQVLVYGDWPGQSKNIKSFFTASFSEKTILEVQEKRFFEPHLFIFVGNLVPGKGLKKALKLIQGLQQKGIHCRMEIYGEGLDRIPMECYVQCAGIKEIDFKGNRSLEDLKLAYQKAHFVILPSKSEGWPKAVAEGMFFGCIPVVTDVSCVKWMLGGGERGIIVNIAKFLGGSSNGTEKNVIKIIEVLKNQDRMQRMSEAAREWSQQYTLEQFEKGIKDVLKKSGHSGFNIL